MRECYGWNYSFDSDFNFMGGVVAFLKALYDKRHRIYGDQYGCGKNKKRVEESEVEKLSRVGELDESDITNHQIKLLFANGMGWGLRGSSEYAMLEIKKNIVHGVFEQSCEQFAGMEWYGYDNLVDKSQKLSTKNGWVRDYKVCIYIYIYIYLNN